VDSEVGDPVPWNWISLVMTRTLGVLGSLRVHDLPHIPVRSFPAGPDLASDGPQIIPGTLIAQCMGQTDCLSIVFLFLQWPTLDTKVSPNSLNEEFSQESISQQRNANPQCLL
jgi:hypothetical protein